VLVKDPAQLEMIRQKELDVTRERCQKLIAAGANVILCGRGIDDFALKYFVEAGAMAIRRVSRADLRRIAGSSGAKVMINLSDFDGEETVDPTLLGSCERVFE
jgi:T-complex protein 1 subunit alpha